MESVIVQALRGVTLTVEEGDFVALMGPSGSGKSTLLNLLGCLDRPTAGQYYLGDEDVSRMSDDQLSDIRSRYLGFVFQSYNLLAQYTVVENIDGAAALPGLPAQRRDDAGAVSSWRGWSAWRPPRPPANATSGGQQRRVAIARSLVNDPISSWQTSRPAT
jgi:putative ABC transport system ATP-binding protein